MYKSLPESHRDLTDSPMRSAVALFFRNLDLKGSEFVPRVQFMLGDLIEESGIHVRSGTELDPLTQAKIHARVFGLDDRGKGLVDQLLAWAMPLNRDGIQTILSRRQAMLERLVSVRGQSIRCFTRLLEDELVRKPLPNLRGLSESAAHDASLFEGAMTSYEQALNPEELRVVLKDLSRGKNLSKAQVKYLKRARKASIELRSSYRLFSLNSKPWEFTQFARKLGALNDELEDHGEKSVRQMAKDLRPLVREAHAELNEEFLPRTPDEFNVIQKDTLDWMDETLKLDVRLHTRGPAKGREPDYLTVDRYHELRRRIRDYKTLFDLLRETYPENREFSQIAQRVRSINTTMGRIKDGLTRGEEKEELPIETRPTEIDAETRRDITEFIRMMKRAI
jgi:hypothetical protein